MALSEQQAQNAKTTLEKLTHEELLEVKGILDQVIKKQELVNPKSEQDESTRFLLSRVAGEDINQQAEDAAVAELVRLSQGR